jgi:hypothetical protein
MFRVFILGRHFKMDVNGKCTYMGFYTTRYIQAASSEEARELGIAAVRGEESLKRVTLNDHDDPPLLAVDEIDEVSEYDGTEGGAGFVIFKDEIQCPSSEKCPPPYLVIRKGVAFWTTNLWVGHWTATRSALKNGVYDKTSVYDANGNHWQSVRAEFLKKPSLLDIFQPAKQLPVQLELELVPGSKPSLEEILAEVTAILESESPCIEPMERASEMLSLFMRATTLGELRRNIEHFHENRDT